MGREDHHAEGLLFVGLIYGKGTIQRRYMTVHIEDPVVIDKILTHIECRDAVGAGPPCPVCQSNALPHHGRMPSLQLSIRQLVQK